MAILLSLVTSISMIKLLIQDWNKDPLTTSIERIDGTIANNSDFLLPSVTFCKASQPDNWALTELIFNLFDFHCIEDHNQCKR